MERKDEMLSDKITIQSYNEIVDTNISNNNNNIEFQKIDTLNQNNNKSFHINTNKKYKINIFENDEELNLRNQNKCLNEKTYGNIGRNLVLFNYFVFGPKNYLWLLILIMLGIAISWFIWIYSMGDFYSKIIYNILHFLFFLTQFFMLLSYTTEPGIIPRNHPEFRIKENENNENNDSKIPINNNENNENKGNNIETTPRIFTERECKTCKIIRPPRASHCRTCDNCIMDLDHHCVFVSNCIGKRNHKYFYLFLLFGSIYSILCVFFNLITIFYVFIIKAKYTLVPLFKGNKWLFFLSIILLLISFLFSTNRFLGLGLILFPGISGFGCFLYMWYKFIPKNDTTPSYFNPYILLVFIIAIVFGIFVIGNFVGQTYHIGRGYTVKQSISIRDKMIDLAQKNNGQQINANYYRRLSNKEKMKNIISFLFTKVDKSLITKKDLFLNK